MLPADADFVSALLIILLGYARLMGYTYLWYITRRLYGYHWGGTVAYSGGSLNAD